MSQVVMLWDLFSASPLFSNLLGREDWVCMPRFPVRQSGKIRPVDDGSRTGSGANLYGFMQEQLQVPSVDFAVTVTRYMKRLTGGAELGAWDCRRAGKSQCIVSTGIFL